MTTSLNTYPYYDDFDEDKNFAKVLFVPGRSVQARELTQLQTILQEQIARHGRHMFKNGTMILPGHIFYDNATEYVKIAPKNSNGVLVDSFIEDIVGMSIVGATSGVTATVIHVTKSTSTTPPTLYVRYMKAGETTQQTKFSANESISVAGLSNTTMITETSSTFTGLGSLCYINDGIYFINGYFVKVQKQTVVLDMYGTKPSKKVGLEYKETIVTEKEDETLYDNAIGFSNHTAPGAHRLKIDLTLVSKDYDFDVIGAEAESDTELKFIDLLQVREGAILFKANETKYAEFERLLARRTADESGDYIVKPFKHQVNEYRSNMRGQWVTGVAYLRGDVVTNGGKSFTARNDGISGATAPTHVNGVKTDGSILWTKSSVIFDNKGVYKPSATATITENLGLSENLVVTVSDGKAYVSGFEIKKENKTLVTVPKARTSQFVNSAQILGPSGSYVVADVTNVPNLLVLEQLEIRDDQNLQIGSCRVRNIRATPVVGATNRCNVYVFDVRMNAGKNFALHAKSLYSVSFTAALVKQKLRINGSANILSGSLNTINGLNTNYLIDLQVGAVVYANIGTTPTTHRVTSITNDVTAVVTPNMVAANGVTIDLEYVDLLDTGSNITKLPHDAIKSLRDPNGGLAIDTAYIVNKYVTNIVNGVYVASVGEAFEQTGHILAGAGSYTVAGDGSSITFSGVTGTISGILVTKRKNSSAKEKKKTLSTKTVYVFDTGVYDGPNKSTATLINATSKMGQRVLSLAEADVIRLTSVVRSGDSSPSSTLYQEASEIDITSKFTLNNGQTDDYYGIASISGDVVNRVLKISFDYFEHSVGDYFSVDSYSDVRYEEIPRYRNAKGTTYKLSDCLDFRPRMSDDGAGFSGVGAVVGSPVVDNAYIVFDYSYYLPRKDKISVAANGDVKLISGTPAETPAYPSITAESIDLFNVSLTAYTSSATPDDVVVTEIDHKRYTMKDIGNLDKRLTNVEEYVALTLEEKETADLKIVDQYGLDRFKNGFFVDSFKDFSLTDDDAVDLRCSVDASDRSMRPTFARRVTRLIEREGTADAFRASNNYAVRGNIASLAFTETPLVSQTQASRGEFINPFNVVSFNGAVTLLPNTDNWVEIQDVVDRTAANAARARIGQSWINGARAWTWSSVGVSGGSVTTQTLWAGRSTITSVNTRLVQTRTTISTNVVPFVRGKKILASVTGLKPFAKIESFVNGENISSVVAPAEMVTITGVSGTFLDLKTGQNLTDRQSARTVSDIWTDPTFRTPSVLNSHIISNGEVLSFRDVAGVEKATAVCAKFGAIRVGASDVTMLRVVNFIGTMTNVTQVVGTTSGASATTSSGLTTMANNADSLGNYFAVITLPHRKFRTGMLDVEFMDVASYDRAASSCHAAAVYAAIGNIQENQFIEQVDSFNTSFAWTVAAQWSWFEPAWQGWGGDGGDGGGDPLCQSFLLPATASDGAVVTSVDLFFHTKPVGETLPVIVQVVEMDNGYPTPRVVRGGISTLEAAKITADSTKLVPTRATFDAPVLLQPGVEYGLKVLSNSNAYKVWIARMGDVRIDIPTSVVTAQPHTGSLFKSQNNSTWTAEQLEDLSFVLNRAKYDTSRSGVVSVVNAGNDDVFLPPDPISIVAGQTTARVLHPNHGFRNGDSVSISGSGSYDATYVVANAREDYYYITIAAPAVTDSVGGLSVIATNNIRYESLMLMVQNFVPTNTALNATFGGVLASGIETTSNPAVLNTLMQSGVSRYVLSNANQSLISGQKSARVTLGLSSTTDYLSPLIAFDAMDFVMVSNVIDNPATTLNVENSADVETIAPGSSVFEADDDSVVVTNNINSFITGAYLKFTGLVTNAVLNSTLIKILRVDASANKLYLDAVILDETVTPTTTKQYTAFVDEVSQDKGTTASKYISKQIRLDSTSTGLRVMYAADIPNDAEIDLYYRIGVNDISKVTWVKVPTSYKKSSTANEFLDQEYTLDNLAGFNTYQIKLVMRSANKAMIPRVKSLRGIALA